MTMNFRLIIKRAFIFMKKYPLTNYRFYREPFLLILTDKKIKKSIDLLIEI